MWETRHSIAEWVYSKTQTLLATLKTRNQRQEESCVFSVVEHLFQSVGCMLALMSSCMGEVVLWSMRGSGAWSDGVTTPFPCGRPARHLGLPESCRFCDASVGTCGTP